MVTIPREELLTYDENPRVKAPDVRMSPTKPNEDRRESPNEDPREKTDWGSTKQTDEPWKGPPEKEQQGFAKKDDLERWQRTNTH